MSSGIEDVYEGGEDGPPPAKRPRVLSKACETCQIKKAKCDSARPKCASCRVKGTSCVYRQKGQPGLRPGYGKAVEKRLETLEDSLDKMNQTLQHVLGHVQSCSHEPPVALQQEIPVPAATDSIPNEPRSAQLWQTSDHLLGAAGPPYTPTSALPQASEGRSEAIASSDNGGLPPDDIMLRLVELFFDKVYPWAPIFYKPQFMASMHSADRQVILHGIVVVAFRYWKEVDNPPPQTREAYIRSSREKIILHTVDTCSLISTQALALLAADAIGQGPSPRTWKVMAMLHTAAQELGLGRIHSFSDAQVNTPLVGNEDPDDDVGQSLIEAEEKRRLFWLIYRQDQFTSVSRGQAGTIDVGDIRLPYPAREADWGVSVAPTWFEASPPLLSTTGNSPSPPGNVLWQYYIDLMVFLDQTNRLLVKPVNLSLPTRCQEWQNNFRRLDLSLSTWLGNLPSEVKDPPTHFDPVWIMLHAISHLINIRMYTVAAFPSTSSPYIRPSATARGRCRQAIRDMASLVTSVQPHELESLSPVFAFAVWVASRSLVILWTSGYETTYTSMPTDLEPMLCALRQCATLWPCAQHYADIIQLILDTKDNPGGPTGLDIFNDTRRTSYGLQTRLGTLVAENVRSSEVFAHSFDFLDIALLNTGDFGAGRGGHLNMEVVYDWL